MQSQTAAIPLPGLDALLARVFESRGYDFRDYRRNTVTRRLARRLVATGVDGCLEYMRYLDDHPGEYMQLVDYLTVKTSGFFRSPHAWWQLAGRVLPELWERRGRLRFWSAACARGEEPYSLAILLAEYLGPRWADADVTIYATDISQRALDEARAAIYSAQELEMVPAGLRGVYFRQLGDRFQVREDIRQRVRFFPFDLATASGPPLTCLDGILCCNVLIYFQRPLQERVLNLLHDALASPGYLMLGEVESLAAGLSDRMECLDGKARIFRKVQKSKGRLVPCHS